MKKSFNRLIINDRTYTIDDTYLWIDGRKVTGEYKKHIKKYCPSIYMSSPTVKKQIKEQDKIYEMLNSELWN